MRRVAGPASRDTSSVVPTATMRSPRTPTAWATVKRSSTVMILPVEQEQVERQRSGRREPRGTGDQRARDEQEDVPAGHRREPHRVSEKT